MFQYTALDVNGTLYEMYVQEFFICGSAKIEAQIKALERIKENCDMINFFQISH